MDQPLFSCTKCFQNFPQSEMSRSGQTCKGCNHHTTFKQCEYCKSDFKYYVYGDICPRCQSLRSKYGEPQPCSICMLKTAFGSALVCQRCLHYRNRFGEPRQCQTCGNMCAFLKDEASREKVDGQILCWVCTYNFKLARSRERSSHGTSKRRHDAIQISDSSKSRSNMDSLKRTRSDDYASRKSDVNSSGVQQTPTQMHSLDSVYNEQILTIGQLQDQVGHLNRKLGQKEAELLAKDRIIAELRSEMIEIKESHEDRILKLKAAAQVEQDRLSATIRQLQREKITLSQGMKRQRSSSNLTPVARLRYSASSVALFNPDSPVPYSATEKLPSVKRLTKPHSNHSEPEDEEPTSDQIKCPKPETQVPTDLSEESQGALSQGFAQPFDEESNLSADVGSVEARKTNNTNSPDLTPSVTSGSQTDDEEQKVPVIHKEALGLETPSDSEEERQDEAEDA